tara:strand:- start:4210 stop:4419 length:210 start_codon:yes stop_codon:yes gene_type:complete
MMRKEVVGIGVPSPDTCGHKDLDEHDGSAICNDCNRILVSLEDGVDLADPEHPCSLEDVSVKLELEDDK